jgi:hypothetical protein
VVQWPQQQQQQPKEVCAEIFHQLLFFWDASSVPIEIIFNSHYFSLGTFPD